MRLGLDKNLELQKNLNILDGSEKTIIFNSIKNSEEGNLVYIRLDYSTNIIPQILNELYDRNILSVIIEGGKQLLESFIESNLWDEAYVFTGRKYFYNGIKAPGIPGKMSSIEPLDNDFLYVFFNNG